jgi:hypothetical protein
VPVVVNALKNGYVVSLVGALLVGGAIGWLVLGGSGSSTSSSTKPGTHQVQVSLRRGVYPPLGLALEQPTSWLTSSPAGTLTLASPDAGLTSMTISDPAPAGNANKLRPAINSQLVKTFSPAKVIAQRHGPIGKTAAITTAILGTGGGKRQILILSTAISSPYRTYSIQVFFKAPRPTAQSLAEVRNMLASIRFFAPTG